MRAFACHNGLGHCVLWMLISDLGESDPLVANIAMPKHMLHRYNPLTRQWCCANDNRGDWSCHSIISAETDAGRKWVSDHTKTLWKGTLDDLRGSTSTLRGPVIYQNSHRS